MFLDHDNSVIFTFNALCSLMLCSDFKLHNDCIVSRTNTAKELVSHDPRSNVYNYKHVFSVEIVPVCKDDVVCLPASVARHLGNMSQICVVLRVTQVVQLIDVNTCHGECFIMTIMPSLFWVLQFGAYCTPVLFWTSRSQRSWHFMCCWCNIGCSGKLLTLCWQQCYLSQWIFPTGSNNRFSFCICLMSKCKNSHHANMLSHFRLHTQKFEVICRWSGNRFPKL